MSRKTINLNKECDVEKWSSIKMAEINKRDNPDLGDTQLLREMMDVFEQEVVED